MDTDFAAKMHLSSVARLLRRVDRRHKTNLNRRKQRERRFFLVRQGLCCLGYLLSKNTLAAFCLSCGLSAGNSAAKMRRRHKTNLNRRKRRKRRYFLFPVLKHLRYLCLLLLKIFPFEFFFARSATLSTLRSGATAEDGRLCVKNRFRWFLPVSRAGLAFTGIVSFCSEFRVHAALGPPKGATPNSKMSHYPLTKALAHRMVFI